MQSVASVAAPKFNTYIQHSNMRNLYKISFITSHHIFSLKNALRSFAFFICIVSFSLIYRALNIDLVTKLPSFNFNRSFFPNDLISKLWAKNVSLVLLDANAFYSNLTGENGVISFGIFEKDSHMFRRLSVSLQGWILIELHGKDYRLMRPTKEASIHAEVITHYFMISPSLIIHIPVIFPRNNFYWIAGIDDLPVNYRYLAHLNFSIPLPMAVEAFNCTKLPPISNLSIPICVPNDIDFYLWQLPRARFFECHFEDIVYPFKDTYNLTELNDSSIHSKTLGETLRVAKKMRVPAMLLGGSLLGWYRQCNQIVEAVDGDVGILANEYNPDLFYRLFENKVVKLCCRYGSPGRGLEYRTYLWQTQSYWVDMFLVYPTSEEKLQAYMWGGGILYSFTYPKLHGVCSAELFGILVFIPCNYVEFVEGDFGKDGWFPPKEGYPYLTFKEVRPYEDGEGNAMGYSFKKYDCQKPDPMWGCDPIPENVTDSAYYQNLTEMMKREVPEYWKY